MSRITLGQLEAFFWTARLGSVDRAARHLNLAQPTVSLRLRDLQAGLGERLLERAGRRLRLTNAGNLLLPRAEGILAEIENIQAAGEHEIAGRVRFGVAEGFAAVCVPPITAALRRELPKLRVDLVIATSAGLEQDLAGDRLDLAVLVDPLGHPGLRLVPLGLQETVWAAAPSWGLAQGARPRDLWQVPVLTNPPPSPMFRQVMAWFAAERLVPAKLSLCSSVTVIAELIAAGIGIGVMPAKMIAPYLAAGSIVALPASPPLAAGRVFVSHRSGVPTRAIEAAIRTIAQALQAAAYFVSAA